MRITSSTMLLNAMRQLRTGQGALDRAQSEATSGRRVRTVSDDPVAASRIMRLEGEVRDLDQYVRNGASATTRLSTEDTALSSVRNVLANARKLAMGIKQDDPADPERQAALTQVRQMIDQVISLGNTQVGGEYVFGGARTDYPPFQPDGTYLGTWTERTVEVDHGVTMSVNHVGGDILSPAIAALRQLENELAAGTPATIQSTVATLADADNGVLVAQADTGARLLQVKRAAEDLGRRSGVLLDQRDRLRDVDPAEASVRVIAAQSALERAYAVIGKVFSTSLVDYMR